MMIAIALLIVFYTILGIAVHEGFRRYPKASWIFFLALPIGLTPFWVTSQQDTDWFFWAKLYSILAATWLILAIRCNNTKRNRWPFYLAYIIAIVNLLEAIAKSFITSQALANILIGLSGFLLIALLPLPKSINVDPKGTRDFIWDTPYSWIIGYTIWDWVLIYLVYPTDAWAHIALLLAPLISAIANPKLYMQARSCTLSFYLIGAITFPHALEWVQGINATEPSVAVSGAILATIWLIGSTGLRIYRLKR